MTRRTVLVVAYHFPPSAASGAFRMLGFARHLPAFGWRAVVVAPPTMPWEPVDRGLESQVPPETIVYSTPYPQGGASKPFRRFARYGVWLPRAWDACRRAVREHRPQAVLTSGPPHCVHLLGLALGRRHGLSWVADFRDPWVSDGRGGGPGRWSCSAFMEAAVMRRADAIVANAPRACEAIQAAHPAHARKMMTITNGYNREAFADAPGAVDASDRPLTIVHVGELYHGRDPRPLLDALRGLGADRGPGRPGLRLRLLGRSDGLIDESLRAPGLDKVVEVHDQVPYAQALREMASADILLLLDTPGRAVGVPAKLYEYIGSGRPILALAEPDGDTAAILRDGGVLHRIAPPTDAGRIGVALDELVEDVRSGRAPGVVGEPRRLRYTRERIAGQLAALLDRCADGAIGAHRDASETSPIADAAVGAAPGAAGRQRGKRPC